MIKTIKDILSEVEEAASTATDVKEFNRILGVAYTLAWKNRNEPTDNPFFNSKAVQHSGLPRTQEARRHVIERAYQRGLDDLDLYESFCTTYD